MMLAAFSLASCSSDDDGNDVYEVAELGGTWQKVYEEGVADADLVEYTSHAHIHPLLGRGVRHCTQYLQLPPCRAGYSYSV